MSNPADAALDAERERKTLYVVNPMGHSGAGIGTWERFQALWPDPIDPEAPIGMERPGHAREIKSEPPAILDLDGDIFGTTPATFTVCPGALRVLTPN